MNIHQPNTTLSQFILSLQAAKLGSYFSTHSSCSLRDQRIIVVAFKAHSSPIEKMEIQWVHIRFTLVFRHHKPIWRAHICVIPAVHSEADTSSWKFLHCITLFAQMENGWFSVPVMLQVAIRVVTSIWCFGHGLVIRLHCPKELDAKWAENCRPSPESSS